MQAAIVAAHADLPSSLTRNPTYRKLNSALFPVMAIAMTSDVLTQGQIYDAADAVISQRLSQIHGVGGVNVNGSALPAVRVEINPLALSKYGIGLQDVRAAISNANANAPKGAIESDRLHYQIYTNDNARDAAPYRNLIIANRNGATVRLGDVAHRVSTCRTAPPKTCAPTACTTASPPCSCRYSSSPAPTSSRWSMPSKRSCRS